MMLRLAITVIAVAAFLPLQCHAQRKNVDHLIHIVVDGLGSSSMDVNDNPNFAWLKANGACTMDARIDPVTSQTLPNHLDMFTGLTVMEHGYDEDMDFGALDTHKKYQLGWEVKGNDLYYNRCCGKKPKRVPVNEVTKEVIRTGKLTPGIENIFDLVAKRGGKTGFYGSKDKFDLFRRSWPIDRFVFNKRSEELIPQALLEIAQNHFTYTYLHIINPDGEGHSAGGADTKEYRAAINLADQYLGQVRNLIENDPEMKDNTAIILTADHGFSSNSNHADHELHENYQIPFCTVGPGVKIGADLYEMNGARGVVHPWGQHGSDLKVIRNGYVGPLAADWLGYTSTSEGLGNQYLAFRDDISTAGPTVSPTDAPSTWPSEVISNVPSSSPTDSLEKEEEEGLSTAKKKTKARTLRYENRY